jgi:hypothetical protein
MRGKADMQPNRSRIGWLLLVMLLTAAGLAGAGENGPPTVVRLTAGEHELALGETLLVAVQVTGIPEPGMAAFQIAVEFDPEMLDVRNPNERFRGSIPAFRPLGGSGLCAPVRGTVSCEDPEWLLEATGRRPVGTDSIAPERGVVRIAYGTRGRHPLPSGDGTLALLEVVGKQAGTTTLQLSEVILADNREPPSMFPVQVENLALSVEDTSPWP